MSIEIRRTDRIRYTNIHPEMQRWHEEANERIFSLAVGDRLGQIGPRIMEVGYAKVLYAANKMGASVNGSFIFFAPDGTCSLNIERTRRGFSYGGLLDMDFDGLLATSNSMPNGCGFSTYEIEGVDDVALVKHLENSQERLGEDELSQLGKGNHFAGVYRICDPVSGEDTGRRCMVVHCSGHVGGDLLYYPWNWLAEEDGYHSVDTPHGPITMLEGEARRRYIEQFKTTESTNSDNRDRTAEEILEGLEWKRLSTITHQGLLPSQHLIGTQKYDGELPIAFNPEEGLAIAKSKPNLSNDVLDSWTERERVESLGIRKKISELNLTPHGGGYELRFPFDSLSIDVDSLGIRSFSMRFHGRSLTFNNFREIREWLTYRRKLGIMYRIFQFDLADHLFDLPAVMQVYPKTTVPGGTG